MPRTLEFNKDEAIDAAMRVFWTNGYLATTLVDLEQATTLRPGSLYNTFSSKKGLFLAAIDYYRLSVVQNRISTILDKGGPLEGIEAFFRTAYEDLEPDQLIGCLLTNSAIECGSDDTDIQKRIAAGIADIEAGFCRRLTEAQAAGLFEKEVDAPKMALHLTSCYQGFGVIGRLTRDKARLQIITDQALASLAGKTDEVTSKDRRI